MSTPSGPDSRLTPPQLASLRGVFSLFLSPSPSSPPRFDLSSLTALLRALDAGGGGGAPPPHAVAAAALLARYDVSGAADALSFEAFTLLLASEPLAGVGGAPARGALEAELARAYAVAEAAGGGVGADEVARDVAAAGLGGSFSPADAAAVLAEGGARVGGGQPPRLALAQWLDLVKLQGVA